MVGISEVKSLAARRQALVAESEAYRQTLHLELQNIRLYGDGLRRKLRLVNTVKPLLMVLPFAGVLFGWRGNKKEAQKRGGWRRVAGGALAGWRLYGKLSPFLRSITDVRHRAADRRNQERAE
jgi:hypothetical protein